MKRFEGNIYPAVAAGLEGLQFYRSIDRIRRFAPDNFPIHAAIHDVIAVEGENSSIYSPPHVHPEEDEVNILVSKSHLLYRISLDDEVYEVKAPATVWIPSGLRHSSNVIEGEGFFICIRFPRSSGTPSLPKS